MKKRGFHKNRIKGFYMNPGRYKNRIKEQTDNPPEDDLDIEEEENQDVSQPEDDI